MACRQKPCCWKPYIDEKKFLKRKDTVEKEITRVKLSKEIPTFESPIARSAMLGGSSTFMRLDLLRELSEEKADAERLIHMVHVDKEFHDAVASKDDYFEIR